MTNEITFRAKTPEEREQEAKELEQYEANMGICVSCGS